MIRKEPPESIAAVVAAGDDRNCAARDNNELDITSPTLVESRTHHSTRTERTPKRTRRVKTSPVLISASTSHVSPAAAAVSAPRSKCSLRRIRKTAIDLLETSSSSDEEGFPISLKAAKPCSKFMRMSKQKKAGSLKVSSLSDGEEDDNSQLAMQRTTVKGPAISLLSEDDQDDDTQTTIPESLQEVSLSRQSFQSSVAMNRTSKRVNQNAPLDEGQGLAADRKWMSSFNTTRSKRNNDSDSSSDESSSYSNDEIDLCLSAIRCRNWTHSRSFPAKIEAFNELNRNNDKALQMLLWDVGFEYTLLSHQFEAVRAVAGLAPSFPLDESDEEEESDLLKLEGVGSYARKSALCKSELARTRGLLLADDMGLGKTIESLAGATLRSSMSVTSSGNERAKRTQKKRTLPTLIVSPGDGIQNQWYETLRKAGVEPARIRIIGDRGRGRNSGKRRTSKTVRGGSFILCTRYKIQSEMKRLFEFSSMTDLQARHKSSVLFPHVPLSLIYKLRNQYRAENAKETNKFIRVREAKEDCVTRLIRESFPSDPDGREHGQSSRSFKVAFQTVIIDEAHFVKNVLAFWGMGCALLGAQSARTVLLSGTPYNNGPQDLAALMTFIDPMHFSSNVAWWERATAEGSALRVVRAVREWRKDFMIRRTKDVLAEKLPPRTRRVVRVGTYPSELSIYEVYENKFLSALDQMQINLDDGSPEARQRVRELFDIMMATMATMRMTLIHPQIPGGREVTIQFSPSRRHLIKRQERPTECVLCAKLYPTQVADEYAARKAAEVKGEGKDDRQLEGLENRVRNEMDLDDDGLDDEDGARIAAESANREKGPFVEFDAEFCRASGSECRHFAHERCLEVFRGKGVECPRCYDLSCRLHIKNDEGSKVPHNIYCKNISIFKCHNGFKASAKIEAAIRWFRNTVPKTQKAIILSFFKGSLDLIEGILTHDLNIDVARYDGDINKELRSQELNRFKTYDSCRVLLASVQSGGTGLNIAEANHVCFLDRWFNPCVHDQAESRCHRLGQKKEVKITYLDTNLSVDDVMRRINVIKEGNASVLLADGTSLGAGHRNIGYQELSGVIGNTLKAIQSIRYEFLVKSDGVCTLPAADDAALDAKIEDLVTIRKKKKSPNKFEEQEVLSDCDTEDGPSSDDDDSVLLDEAVFGNGETDQKASAVKHEETSSESSSSNGDDILNEVVVFGNKGDHEKEEGLDSNEAPGIGDSSKIKVAGCSQPTEIAVGIEYNSELLVAVKGEEEKRPLSVSSSSTNDSILKEVFRSPRQEPTKESHGADDQATSNEVIDIHSVDDEPQEKDGDEGSPSQGLLLLACISRGL